uniref:Uncharacterized protein n=1 Tax=Paramormyrops kingsleyae TaxID=1676925 RepID=A0A3B3RGD0_9TELE
MAVGHNALSEGLLLWLLDSGCWWTSITRMALLVTCVGLLDVAQEGTLIGEKLLAVDARTTFLPFFVLLLLRIGIVRQKVRSSTHIEKHRDRPGWPNQVPLAHTDMGVYWNACRKM